MRAPLMLLAMSDRPRRPGGARARVGHVHFATSCASDVQPQFNRGVALLHSFWYEESFRTFAAVSAANSDCAMAYWGQAMSLAPSNVGAAVARRLEAWARPERTRDDARAYAARARLRRDDRDILSRASHAVLPGTDRRVRAGNGESVPAEPPRRITKRRSSTRWRPRATAPRTTRPARGRDARTRSCFRCSAPTRRIPVWRTT